VSAELLAERADARVYHADWRALLDVVRDAGGCDALIVDAPYSERTHSGHDDGAVDANRGADMAKRYASDPDRRIGTNGRRPCPADTRPRRTINYGAWSDDDVRTFVESWLPAVRGWLVTVTDHILAPAWAAALEMGGRYVFAPLPFYAPGSRVRLSGDGPSTWVTWIVVARPRTREFFQWGTLPGGYALPPGHAERMPVVGGKPLWLMEALVRDYSRPGDLVVDPCAGAFTTGVACQRNGRRFIGGDALREHAELGARRISKPAQQPLFLAGGGK
jgi:hypothetical protein